MNKKLFTSGLFIIAGLLMGRITGFGREFFMAYKLGTSEFADIAVILFTLPDYLVGILTAGGLSYALLPEFRRLPKERAASLFVQSSLLIGLFYALITLLLIYGAGGLVYVIAPGITDQMNVKTADFIKLSLWVIPLSALTGITTAYLQSAERFAITALATPLFNTGLILGLLYVGQSYGEFQALTYFILGAAVVRFLSQFFFTPYRAFQRSYFKVWEISKPLLKNYFLISLSGCTILFFPQIIRFFGSFEGTGSLAKLSYSIKMSEIPLGVFLTSLSILLFPKFAEHFRKDTSLVSEEGMNLLRNAIKLITITGLACVMVMIVFAEDLTRWAYGWGSMSEASLTEISLLLAFALIGIIPQGITSLLICVYNAKADSKPLIYMNIVGALFLCIGCLGTHSVGLLGIVFIYILNSYLMCGLQLVFLIKRHQIVVIEKDMVKDIVISLGAMLILLLPLTLSTSTFEVASWGRLIHIMLFSPVILLGGLVSVTDFRQFAMKHFKKVSE